MDVSSKQATATVLFTRIRDYARIVNILDLNETYEFLADYAEVVISAAAKYRGALANVTGDELRIMFADPGVTVDSPRHAVFCALNIQNTADSISVRWRHALDFLVEIDIGISTGQVFVGNVTRGVKKMYTLIGKNVVLAKQLAELSAEYNTNILIDVDTLEGAKDYFSFRKVGDHLLLGFTDRIELYTPVVSAK
ncbi:MAG: adenylate/guanylate cyclase domain-containing protein [candidate division WOR-3 bacterium]|nr:MAG: adenylate/guanylate cyclase domain-containing protein [candidate division WOR-3 bacterium]